MAERISKEQRSLIMSHIHSNDTKPELSLRRSLWHNGFRYVINDRKLPGKPDIVLPKYRTVIFVHGCFWHGHKECASGHIPESNTDYWIQKITRNQLRDQEVWRQLEAKGWFVIIVWECELKKAVLDETIARVEAEIRQNGKNLHQAQDDRRKAREAYLQEQRVRKERAAALQKEISKLNPH